jgi:hypothetical protein
MADASGGQAGEQPVRRALRSGSGIARHGREARAVRSTCPAQHTTYTRRALARPPTALAGASGGAGVRPTDGHRGSAVVAERYGDHDGTGGSDRGGEPCGGHGLPLADRDALIAQAQMSTVLNP